MAIFSRFACFMSVDYLTVYVLSPLHSQGKFSGNAGVCMSPWVVNSFAPSVQIFMYCHLLASCHKRYWERIHVLINSLGLLGEHCCQYFIVFCKNNTKLSTKYEGVWMYFKLHLYWKLPNYKICCDIIVKHALTLERKLNEISWYQSKVNTQKPELFQYVLFQTAVHINLEHNIIFLFARILWC